MRGKKTSEEEVYKVIASYCTTGSYSETARALKMPTTTVKDIVDENIDSKEFEKLRNETKQMFTDKATAIIDKGLAILDKRLTTALEKQDALDRLIDEIESTDEEEISYKHKMSAINLIQEAQIQRIKDISTMIGTLYDKRALAQGESTQNLGFTANSDELAKLMSIAGYKKEEDTDD